MHALLTLDIQVGLVHGPEKLWRCKKLLETLNTLMDKTRSAGAPIFLARHIGPAGSPIEPGSPLMMVAQELKLRGEESLHTHTVLTRNLPVDDLNAAFAADDAMTLRRDGAGVVVLTEDLGGTGTIEYMTYARDENKAFSMERGFLDALAPSLIEESVCE